MPAVQVGLDLDERVVRRHVARLEALGWLIREPGFWGQGSFLWLTAAGLDGVGLQGVRPVRVSPGITTVTHGLVVGWSAARIERRGYVWQSGRELEAGSDIWAVEHRHDYGHSTQLPDIAVWPVGADRPIAIVCQDTRRRDDRQRWRLDGWRQALDARRYERVQYDCANKSLALWIKSQARKVHLGQPEFWAVVQLRAERIATLTPIDQTKPAVQEPQPVPPETRRASEPGRVVPIREPAPLRAVPPNMPPPETREQLEARKEKYRELFGFYDSFEEERPRRRWGR